MRLLLLGYLLTSLIIAQCDPHWNEDGILDIIDIAGMVDYILEDCWQPPIYGCTNPEAQNYNPEATVDDGSCIYDSDCVDIEGNTYATIQIGDQVWMAENLKVAHYRNGDDIPAE